MKNPVSESAEILITKSNSFQNFNANWKKLEVTYQRTGDDVKYDFVVTPDDLS